MKGQAVCVRGIVTEFIQTRHVGSRYQFSKQSGTFFLYSTRWEITSTQTGKTLGPGTCVQVTGTIEVQSGIPYINLDRIVGKVGEEIEGFFSYDDPGVCR
jgi:hypothetical protein